MKNYEFDLPHVPMQITEYDAWSGEEQKKVVPTRIIVVANSKHRAREKVEQFHPNEYARLVSEFEESYK
jgi:hypothetical protein